MFVKFNLSWLNRPRRLFIKVEAKVCQFDVFSRWLEQKGKYPWYKKKAKCWPDKKIIIK